MNSWSSLFLALFAVIVLVLLSLLGVGSVGLATLFGVVIPYAAGAVFVLGVVWRVVQWARVPVPFRIPSTCGQGKSLPWIKADNLECPYNTWGVIGRMLLEVLFFRSLFRNTRAELRDGPRLTYASAKWLWLGGILFHYSFLIVVLRHFRFFIEPVPHFVELLASVDGFFQILLPTVFLSDVAFLAAVTYLFLRRVALPELRYISLTAGLFPAVSHPGDRDLRSTDAECVESRSFEREATDHGTGYSSPDGTRRGNRVDLLCSRFPCERTAGLYTLQQDHARRWRVSEPHEEYGK